jgi:putative ATPase
MPDMDLFEAAGRRDRERARPLADRMRPTRLEEVVGQEHLTGPDGVLTRMVAAASPRSLILFGPPGTGKTTLARILAEASGWRFVPLSAVESGVADVRRTVNEAREAWAMEGRGTLVFLDEIHRFNRAQQDVLLPHVEDGTIVLVGSTAENPWVSVNAALLSRCLLLEVKELSPAAIGHILARAVARAAEWCPGLTVEAAALTRIAERAGGDARLGLSLLEWCTLIAPGTPPSVDVATVEKVWRDAPHYHDRAGDRHYDEASAFIKSLRGSDPDAALFWFGQMLAGGEDPRFLARRLLIHAAEDVGLADPRALLVAAAAWTALEAVGLPEARIPLAEAVIYIATAPKSNSVVRALAALDRDLAQGRRPVPEALRDGNYPRRDTGYRYPHEAPDHFLPDWHLPAGVGETPYYEPGRLGEEAERAERLAVWNRARREARSAPGGPDGAGGPHAQ